MKKDASQVMSNEPLDPMFLNSNRFFDWISEHASTIVYTFLVAIGLLLVMLWVTHKKQGQASEDFLSIEYNFSQLKLNFADDRRAAFDTHLKQIQEVLARHPELHQKYDGLLAQTLILAGQPQLAEEYAQRVFVRTQNEESPFYIDFSENTLRISQEDYSQALVSAKELKEKMRNDTTHEALYMTNLIRIAALEQKLGSKEEIAAWQEIETFVKDRIAPETLATESTALVDLINHFSEGRVTLFDYIQTRKNLKNTTGG